MITAPIDPELDLVLERTVPVPPEDVWAAWTTPSQVVEWFTPRPWTTTACDIDLRPGGVFRTVMRSPDGEEFDNSGFTATVGARAARVREQDLLRLQRQPGAADRHPTAFAGALSLYSLHLSRPAARALNTGCLPLDKHSQPVN